MFADINKWAAGEKGARALKVLPKGLKILYAVNSELSRPEVQLILNQDLVVGSFFMDPEHLVQVVSDEHGYMSRASLERLLNSTFSVTEIYGLSELTSVRTLICDPEKMADLLVLPDAVTTSPDAMRKATENRQVMAMISGELCRLDDDQIDHLATLVQDHLNISSLLRKGASFANAVDEVEMAKMLNNFADMVSVVSVVPGLGAAQNTLNKSMTIAQWLADTKPLWTTASDEKRRNAVQNLDKILGEVEPFLRQLAGNHDIPSWTGFRQSMATMAGFFQLFDMLMTTPLDIDGASFANFFTDIHDFETKTRETLKPYGLGHPENVTAILESKLRFDKFAAVLSRVENGTAAKRLLCEYPGLMELFRFPEWFSATYQMQVQNVVCSLSSNSFRLDFLRQIDTNKVVNEYVKVSKRSIRSLPDGSFVSIDQGIRRATRELRDVAKNVDDLLDVYEQVQPAQLYQSLMGVVKGEVAENIDPLLLTGATVFQFFLERLPDMWGLLRGPIAMTDVALEFIEHILYTPSLIDDYAAYRLMASPEGRAVGQLVISEGSATLKAFLENLRVENTFQQVYQHPVALAEYACDKIYLRKALEMDTNRFSLSQIMDEICSEQFKLLLLRLRRDAVSDLNFGRISSAASEMTRSVKNYPLLEPSVIERANITSVLTRLSRIIGYSEHPLFNEQKLDAIVDSFRYEKPADRRVAWEGWSKMKKLMKKRWTIEQFVRSSDWLGPLLEQLPNWEQLRPGFEITRMISSRMNDILWFSNTIFHYSASMVEAALGSFTNYEEYLEVVSKPLDRAQHKLAIGTSRYLSKMLFYVVKYSPAIVKGTLEAAVDPAKILQVSMSLLRDPSSLCYGRTLDSLFDNLDPSVPTDELRRFLCSDRSVGFVDELQTLFDWKNFTKKIERIVTEPMPKIFGPDGIPEHIPFDWTGLTDSALQMYESGQVLLTAGQRWADFVRETAEGDRNITVSTDFFKLMKPDINFEKVFSTETLVRTVPFFMQLLDGGAPRHSQQVFRRGSQLLTDTIAGALSSGKRNKYTDELMMPEMENKLAQNFVGMLAKPTFTFAPPSLNLNRQMAGLSNGDVLAGTSDAEPFSTPLGHFFTDPSHFNEQSQFLKRKKRSILGNWTDYMPKIEDFNLRIDKLVFNLPKAIGALSNGEECDFGKAVADSIEYKGQHDVMERASDVLCGVDWLDFANTFQQDPSFGSIASSLGQLVAYGRYIRGELPINSPMMVPWLSPVEANYTHTLEVVNQYIEMVQPQQKATKKFDDEDVYNTFNNFAHSLDLDPSDPRLYAQVIYYGNLQEAYRDLMEARLWEAPPGSFKQVLVENFPDATDEARRFKRQIGIDNLRMPSVGGLPSFSIGDVSKLAKAASALGSMFKLSETAAGTGNDLIPPNTMWARAKNENGTTLPLHKNSNLKTLAERFYQSNKIGDVAGVLTAADHLEPVLRDRDFVSKLGKMTHMSSHLTNKLGNVVETMPFKQNSFNNFAPPPLMPPPMGLPNVPFSSGQPKMPPNKAKCRSCDEKKEQSNTGGGGGLLGGLLGGGGGLGGLGALGGLAGGLGGSAGGGGDALIGLMTTACKMPALRKLASNILPPALAPALDWVCVMQELHPEDMKKLLNAGLSVLQMPPPEAQNMFPGGGTGGSLFDSLFSMLNVPKPAPELQPFLGPSPSMENTADPGSLLGPFKAITDLMGDVAKNHPGFLCDAVIAPFVNVPSFEGTRLYLNWVQNTAKLLSDVFTTTKTIPDFICDLVKADFFSVYERIRKGTQMFSVVERFSELRNGNTSMLFSCDSLITSVQDVVNTAMYYSSTKPDWPRIVKQCSKQQAPSANMVMIPPILEEVDSLFRILSSMRRRTATKSLRALTSLFSDVEPALDNLELNLKPEQSFKIEVSELFSDRYQTEKLLLQKLRLDPIVVRWLLNTAVIDFEQVHSFNLTRPMVKYVLCNATRLAGFLSASPQANYYSNDISRQACSSPEMLETVYKHITESFSFTKLLEKV